MNRGRDIPAADTAIGRVIGGKFRVIERLGSGGTASVYRARHEQLGKMIALKVMPAKQCPPRYVRRFQREAQAACRLDHPNCVRILDFGQDDDLHYLAMEYVEGETLEAMITREAPMPLARITDLMSQILAGLAAAHDLGIIHRDVKPANVLIARRSDDEGQVFDCAKICDFGMAKVFGAPGEPGMPEENLTDIGVVIGTPHFMSPEQASGQQIDERTDIYACGVVMYEMATGRLPFEAPSMTALLMKHIREQPPPPSRFAPDIDRDLEKLILWALEKDVARRCSTAKVLRRELAKLELGPPAESETELAITGFGRAMLESGEQESGDQDSGEREPDELADTKPRRVVRAPPKLPADAQTAKDQNPLRPVKAPAIPEAVTEPMGPRSLAQIPRHDIEDTCEDTAPPQGPATPSEPILLLPEHKKKR